MLHRDFSFGTFCAVFQLHIANVTRLAFRTHGIHTNTGVSNLNHATSASAWSESWKTMEEMVVGIASSCFPELNAEQIAMVYGSG